MSRYKVCVYAICKDEESFVNKWMDSMQEADLVVVTDTGSRDGTVEALRKRGAEVHVDVVRPWRFDVARNISLDHVPEDVDICVCTDLDEVFESGWRDKLEKAWDEARSDIGSETAIQCKYTYNWSHKPDGSPDVQFVYFKIHSRHGFVWKCPIHEYLQYESGQPLKTVLEKEIVLHHYPTATKSRSGYLPLLEMAVEEDAGDERMRYYLGREYMYVANWQKCIDTLTGFLDMPTALWNEERCAAMRWIAKSYLSTGNTAEAYKWYFKAIAEAPRMRDAYVEFAKMCVSLKDWEMAVYLTGEALNINEKSPTYVNMGYSWDHTPDDLCSLAYFYMGLSDKALYHAKKALSLSPDDERLKNNIKLIEAKGNAD